MSFITAFCQPPAICRPLAVSSAVSNNPVRRLRNYQRLRRASVCMNIADDLNNSKQSDTEIDNTENNGTTPTSTASASPTIDSQNVQTRQDTAVQKLEGADDFGVPKVAQASPSMPTVPSSSSKKQYTMRTRLREEIEAPFRKARMFVYAGSAASAGVGAFISTLRVIAALSGVSGVQPLNETIPNVAVDLGVIGLMAFLLRQETKAGERRLERMSRGARISQLRMEDVATRQVVTLKEIRGNKRVVVIAGRADGVMDAMTDAFPVRKELEESSLRIVPLVTEEYEGVTEEEILRQWRFKPFAKDDWLKWFKEERALVGKRLKNEGDVIVVVIRLDGKVGARSIGKPMWPRLLEEVRRIPPNSSDKFGKP